MVGFILILPPNVQIRAKDTVAPLSRASQTNANSVGSSRASLQGTVVHSVGNSSRNFL